jgi:ferredoxin
MIKRRILEGSSKLITHYGYMDGSGEYFIVIDSDRCDGCGKCVKQCLKGALHIELMFIDLEDKSVAAIKEEYCNKIKYTCAECKPEETVPPCVLSCSAGAISCVFT